MTTDWILRVGDGENLRASSKYHIWGINSRNSFGKYFIKNVKPGDRLWFVTSKSHGKIIAVATYRSHNVREIGPILDITRTDEELGWTGADDLWKCDTEIHYNDLFNLTKCDLLTHIKGACSIRVYSEKCRVNLSVEYSYISRYSKMSKHF